MRRAAVAMGAMLMGLAAADAQVAMTDLDGDLYLGAPVQAENVTVWPVFSKKPAEKIAADLVPLPDAQAQGWAVVREMGTGGPAPQQAPNPPPVQMRNQMPMPNPATIQLQEQNDSPLQNQMPMQMQGPQVNELVIDNKGQKPILVLAGTLLKGGNQDRQVGEDFIVPPGKTVPVTAFCVEHGRWTAERDGKHTAGVFEAKKALAVKSVRGTAQFKSDQGEVWNQVAQENAKAGKAPSTGTFMATVEDDDKDAKARRDRLQATIGGALAGVASQEPVGLAYAVDGKVREVRVFSHPVLFQRLSDTLINTVAVEGDLAQRVAKAAGHPVASAPADAKQVVDLVRGAAAVQAQDQTTKAGNAAKMRKGKAVWSAETFADDKASVPVTKTYSAVE